VKEACQKENLLGITGLYSGGNVEKTIRIGNEKKIIFVVFVNLMGLLLNAGQ